jgi:hypothetical protein
MFVPTFQRSVGYLGDGDGRLGNDAMTIADYVAIGFLLTSLLAAARWFAQRNFELFPTGSDIQAAEPCAKTLSNPSLTFAVPSAGSFVLFCIDSIVCPSIGRFPSDRE